MFIMRLHIWFLVILDFVDISRGRVLVPVMTAKAYVCLHPNTYFWGFGFVYMGYCGITEPIFRCTRMFEAAPPGSSVRCSAVARETTLMMLFSSNFSLFMQSCAPRLVYHALHYIISVCKINMWQWLRLPRPLPRLLPLPLPLSQLSMLPFGLWCRTVGNILYGDGVSLLSWLFSVFVAVFVFAYPSCLPHKAEAKSDSPPCAKYKWICSVEFLARWVFGCHSERSSSIPIFPFIPHLTRRGSHQKFHIHNLIKLTFCWIMYLHDCGTKYGFRQALSWVAHAPWELHASEPPSRWIFVCIEMPSSPNC